MEDEFKKLDSATQVAINDYIYLHNMLCRYYDRLDKSGQEYLERLFQRAVEPTFRGSKENTVN